MWGHVCWGINQGLCQSLIVTELDFLFPADFFKLLNSISIASTRVRYEIAVVAQPIHLKRGSPGGVSFSYRLTFLFSLRISKFRKNDGDNYELPSGAVTGDGKTWIRDYYIAATRCWPHDHHQSKKYRPDKNNVLQGARLGIVPGFNTPECKGRDQFRVRMPVSTTALDLRCAYNHSRQTIAFKVLKL